MPRDLDVVIFGATGDTGIVGCCCLYFKGRKLGISSWAPAARNMGKLQAEVLDRLGAVEPGPDGLRPQAPIEADCNNYASLVAMCARANVVLSCAGPYAHYGEGVVRACIEAGTHYVDITGEVPWVESMMQLHGAEASTKGVLLVSCAGYDSVPPDLTTFLAAKALEAEGESLQRYEAFCWFSGGAMPTGTIETFCEHLGMYKRRAVGAVTFGMLGGESGAQAGGAPPASEGSAATLVPEEEAENFRRNRLWTMLPGYSFLGGGFCLPHFMAPINSPIVHRTAALEGYGGIEYRERRGPAPTGANAFGVLPTVVGVALLPAMAALAAMPYACTVIRGVRDRVNPPLQRQVRDAAFAGFASNGSTSLKGIGRSKSGRRFVHIDLDCPQDCGLGFTMLSGCTVAAEVARRRASSGEFKYKGGFHTAVCAVGGAALADALRNVGVRIEVQTSAAA